MVTKKASGKKPGKLKVRKDTIKHLDVKVKAGTVKGGAMKLRVPPGVPPATQACCPFTMGH